ncbi:Stk1 family PASTA domain-containing Ser/Thr kinase [Microlunatus capsulatus]|uniref:non-specific serine/threonine protein kinase n=1 Tax=Microlunatus capsulatus TaxID=99117 RepID=A0ABS4Z721_9ACTN|nr:Stk1 family PASTA domain-containing Ser/Thr kinase [Microlunatus capsulatus]MBP2416843.1 serine/threonine-protein kinase [Microlunatus capsulatus]
MSATPVVVGDRYELGEPLGRGGMATVHRARDRRLDRQVAVKQLSLHLAADTTAQARFRREAQASASLNHPAIASVFDTGEGTDPATGVALPYIVMELVEGSTLRDVLAAGPLAPDRALTVVRSVLDALAHSHAAGLVHRDIKPANVMITTGGAVKVMDFGIARAVDESATSLTGTASVIGTAQYLSPEQALGRPVDLRSDLYSVGCLLFELVTGRPPFVAETSLAIAYQHVREDPVPPSSLEPSLDPALDAVVLRALAKDPDERYPSAAAMREDVDRLLAGAPVAPPPAPSEPPGTVTAALPPRLAGAAVAATPPGPPTAPTALVGAAAPPAGEDPAPEERRRSSGRRAVLVVLAVFLVLGLGAFGLSRVFGPTASQAVTVPDVGGQSRAAAEAALRDADLVPRVVPRAGAEDDAVGTVLDQEPGADARVPAGSTVTLTVGAGEATATIPDGLVGRPVAEAERALERLGFTDVSTDAVDGDGDAEPGDVVSVKPAEGKRVALDAAVRIRFVRDAAAADGQDESGDDGPTAAAPSASSAPSATADEDAEPSDEPTDDATSEAPDDDPTTDAPTEEPSSSATDEPGPSASASEGTGGGSSEKPGKPEKPEPTKSGGNGGGNGKGGGNGNGNGSQDEGSDQG